MVDLDKGVSTLSAPEVWFPWVHGAPGPVLSMCDSHPMDEWNVVVTVRDHGYTRARRVLGRLGPVAGRPFYNVLVMRTDDILAFLEAVDDLLARTPALPMTCPASSR